MCFSFDISKKLKINFTSDAPYLPKNQTVRGELEVASGCMWKQLVVCDG